ncbi:MAG: nitroreductase family deazaflavin-dependent oxidoreductase, partial [Pseudonocardia sp.]|nr:nitroreductase family deazaflavin-dependent oxidoreductase [Pseudonocardia sp.]
MTDGGSRRRPRRLFRRTPLLLYRGPLARALDRRYVLLLTTRGRTSGRWRTTPLTYLPHDAGLVVYAGARGERSDWYRNLLANPHVLVRTGSRRFRARAHPVHQQARRRELADLFVLHPRGCGPPAPIKWARRVLRGEDYDVYVARAFAQAEVVPFVALEP